MHLKYCILSQNGISDVGFAGLYILASRKEFIDYLKPHDNDNVCFLLSKPPLNPKWMDLLNPFQYELWIATISMLTFCVVLAIIYGKCYPEIGGLNGGMFLIAVFLDQSSEVTKYIK